MVPSERTATDPIHHGNGNYTSPSPSNGNGNVNGIGYERPPTAETAPEHQV